MGDNVIEFRRPEHEGETSDVGRMPYERFLIDEGLELLASYRSIPNADVRRTVRRLMKDLAELFDAGARPH